MAESVAIVVPMLPPQECSPNWHGHWRRRADVARAVRAAAKHATLYAIAPDDREAWCAMADKGLVMDIAVEWFGRRKIMDADNLVASCKPLRDGIADALLYGDDSQIAIGTVTQGRGEGVTVLTLRALTGEGE